MPSIDGLPSIVLGERLRIARTAIRRTQEQAAQALNVARTTLVAIEKGERKVRIEELERMAVLYGVSCNALLQVERVFPEFVPQFRESGPRVDEELVGVVRTLERLASAYVELARLLGIDDRTSFPTPVRLTRDNVNELAEDAALALRSQLGIGMSPIPDLQALVESELGFRVFVRAMPNRVAGAYAFSDSTGPCVLLNAIHPFERRQFTLAHETGHFMSTRYGVDLTLESQEDDLSPRERFADRFGASLLMPAAALRRRYSDIRGAEGTFTPRHLVFLARSFYVSVEGMCRRLEALKLVGAGTWAALRRNGFRASGVDGDPGPQGHLAASDKVMLLASEAYARELVSEGQLAGMLDMDRIAVRKMIDQYAGFEFEGEPGAE